MVMHCGVGICGDCYEVGAEVVAQLRDSVAPDAPGLPGSGGPARIDLREVLLRQGRALGVGAVTVSPWCSAHDRGRFFSHRASGGRDGRMVAYLGRPLPVA
jgi:copper oxidase (laccase) domain-containing protein